MRKALKIICFCILVLPMSVHAMSPIFDEVLSPSPDSATVAESIRYENKQLVQAAVQKMVNHQTYEINVNEEVESQCVNTSSIYQLKTDGVSLTVTLDVVLVPSQNSQNTGTAQSLIDKVKSCTPEIQDYWSRYNVNLDLNYSTANSAQYLYNKNVFVLEEAEGRSNAGKLFVSGLSCGTLAHELSHMVGLPDEYSEEGTCRTPEFAAKESDPYSLMAVANLNTTEIMPRHLTTILGPVHDLDSVIPKFMVLKLNQSFNATLEDQFKGYYEFPQSGGSSSSCQLSKEFGTDNTLSVNEELYFGFSTKIRARSGEIKKINFYSKGTNMSNANNLTLMSCAFEPNNQGNGLEFLKPAMEVQYCSELKKKSFSKEFSCIR